MVLNLSQGEISMVLFHADEIRRKIFHMLIVIYIVAYWYLPKIFVLQALLFVIVLVAIGEAIRLNTPAINQWLLDFLGGVHRKEEANQISGLLWTISGSFFTMLIFPDKRVVMVSLLYLAFGDAFAALIGRHHGKNKIIKNKTIEGSLACFVVCLIIGLFFLDWRLAVWGALLATSIEIIPWPLNDNFWMPLISAIVLTFFSRLH